MQLTPHFSLGELTVTSTGAYNTPPQDLMPVIKLLAVYAEKVRSILGDHPMQINSGYRSHQVNVLVGGVDNSAHTKGYAFDFECPGFGDNFAVAKALQAAALAGKIEYDQLIYEGTWVHISRDPQHRHMDLTHVEGDVYTSGLTK